MKRIAAVLTIAALALLPMTVTGATPTLGAIPAAGHGPLVCGSAVNFEARGWWTEKGRTFDEYAGIDAEMCVPLGPISGKVPAILHIQLRHNLGTINFVRVGLGPDGSVNVFNQSVSLKGDATGDGEWYLPAVLDTTLAPHDGWLEYRLTANMAHDEFGLRQYQSTGVQIETINGKSRVSDYRQRPWWEARGWYQGYENVRLRQDPPTSPVSGTWTVKWEAVQGSGGSPISYHVAYVDADTHAIPMKLPIVLSEGSGAFSGTTSIDTTKLTDGTHKLLLRADATLSTGTVSGLLQVLFTVQNGKPSPTPTATPSATPSIAPTPSGCGA